MASELPSNVAAIFWWNPLLHCVESLRSAFFVGFSSDMVDMRVPLGASLGLYALSKWIEKTDARPGLTERYA